MKCICDTLIEYSERGINPALEYIEADDYAQLSMIYWSRNGETTPAGWYLEASGEDEVRKKIEFCPLCGDKLLTGVLRKEKRLV